MVLVHPSAAQIELVQSSFTKLIPVADTAAGLFYRRLFEIAPEVKPYFRGALAAQGRRLMMTLSIVVGSLNDLSSVLPVMKSLAVKHVGYGVVPLHYVKAGEALMWTLEKSLGDDFTPDVREAWHSAFRMIAGTMIEKAYGYQSAA